MDRPIVHGMAGARESDVAKHSQVGYILRTTVEARMYICLCNALTDRDVRASCDNSSSVSMVYQSLGCQPQCGKCVPFVRQMLREQASGTTEVGGDD
jgi:bacterioferritin-associated ferredoxin